jgi:hypothetical protein
VIKQGLVYEGEDRARSEELQGDRPGTDVHAQAGLDKEAKTTKEWTIEYQLCT